MRQTPYLLGAALLWVAPAFAQVSNTPQPVSGPGNPGQSGPPGQLPPDLPRPQVVGTVPVTVTTWQGPAGSPKPENLTTFDSNTAELRLIDNRWQLLSGGVLVKDFGRREAEAREALRIIRDLHLTQHGTVGSPQPVMEYWLADGKAPQGFPSGLRLLPIDLTSLRVEQFQGQWLLRDARRLLFVFGGHEDDARKALNVIRQHGFSQVGYVGQPVPAMIYFLAGDGFADARMVPPASVAPRPVTPANPEAPGPAAGAGPTTGPIGSAQPKPGNPLVPVTLANGRQLATVNPLVADQPGLGDRVYFDNRQVQARHDNQDWKLYYGGYAIANFGPHQSDARQALNALQLYRCNEHCLVGQPKPVFSYFLANGQAPRGLMFGMGGMDFRPDSLTLRQNGATWTIFDGNKPVIPVSAHKEDAQKLLETIQQQKFDHLTHIGQPEPLGMTLLVRAR